MVKEIKTIDKIQKDNLPERIEKAKRVIQEEYIKFCDSLGIHNPDFKRKWIKYDGVNKYNYIFALDGTPPKAFVQVDEKSNSVVAVWGTGTIFKEF